MNLSAQATGSPTLDKITTFMPAKNENIQRASAPLPSNAPLARLIAFYLPQFHPIPENDIWWGKGFTEWTNVTKAHPLFFGHYQPRLPADLGFYDLRVPEVRAAQAALAQAAGIEGFCYWHYWFAGKRLLEHPFNEVLRLKEPAFPFCLGWANQTWSGIWHGEPYRTLIEQAYPGRTDYENHFFALLEAFHDPRYIRVRGKPMFVVYRPMDLPCAIEFIETWQSLAEKNDLPGIHFVANMPSVDQPYDHRAQGFAAAIASDMFKVSNLNVWARSLAWYQARNGQVSMPSPFLLKPKALARAIWLESMKYLQPYLSRPVVIEYAEATLHFLANARKELDSYPCIAPNWDNSARSGTRAVVLHNSTPQLFRKHLREALSLVTSRPFEDRVLFVKSWNEWAEGNYLEPDQKYGHQYLDVIREEVLGSGHST